MFKCCHATNPIAAAAVAVAVAVAVVVDFIDSNYAKLMALEINTIGN